MKGSGLFIAPEPLDWGSQAGRPRRLQVNAFGFGGTNYVVQWSRPWMRQLRSWYPPGGDPGLPERRLAPLRIAVAECGLMEEPHSAGEASGGPPELQGVSFFRTKMDGRDYRMAVVADSEEEALTVIERSRHLTEGGSVTPRS